MKAAALVYLALCATSLVYTTIAKKDATERALHLVLLVLCINATWYVWSH